MTLQVDVQKGPSPPRYAPDKQALAVETLEYRGKSNLPLKHDVARLSASQRDELDAPLVIVSLRNPLGAEHRKSNYYNNLRNKGLPQHCLVSKDEVQTVSRFCPAELERLN
jgi:hypothetical protein